jgi:hypothetical protein
LHLSQTNAFLVFHFFLLLFKRKYRSINTGFVAHTPASAGSCWLYVLTAYAATGRAKKKHDWCEPSTGTI